MPAATPKLELKDKFIQAVMRKANLDPRSNLTPCPTGSYPIHVFIGLM
jgi:hypothetical protein